MAAAAVTAGVGVCGQARLVRPCARSAVNCMPNGSTAPAVTRAAIFAAAQISAASAASAQQPISTVHPAAVPPGAIDGRGPRARLTAGPPGGSPGMWAARMAWSVS